MQTLFAEDDYYVFAVIDGAADPLYSLEVSRFESTCLYRGELEPEVASVAPYAVRLKENDSAFIWFIDRCWNKESAILVRTTTADVLDVRQHFRRLTRVMIPENQPVLFRFYDPRVLRMIMPITDDVQRAKMFGAIVREFLAEDPESTSGYIQYSESNP